MKFKPLKPNHNLPLWTVFVKFDPKTNKALSCVAIRPDETALASFYRQLPNVTNEGNMFCESANKAEQRTINLLNIDWD